MSSALNVVTSGLPLSATDIVVQALNESFGEGIVSLVSLNKDNLRQRVRLSQRSAQDILVILDSVSEDICKDIENGLYHSDKYYNYTSDRELVEFLNGKYDLNLEVPEESELSTGADDKVMENNIDQDLLDEYTKKLHTSEMLVESLEGYNAELKEEIERLRVGSVDSEEIEKYKSQLEELQQECESLKSSCSEKDEEILNARSELQDAITSRESAETNLESERKVLEKLRNDLKKAEDSRKSLLSDYEGVSAELTNLRVQYTSRGSMLKRREETISKLEERIESLLNTEAKYANLKKEIESYKTQISEQDTKISNLSVDCNSYKAKAERLELELESKGESTKLVSELQEQLQIANDKNSSLLRSNNDLRAKISELEESIKSKSTDDEEVNKLRRKVEELSENLEKADKDITQLNEEKIRMNGELQVLRMSSDADTDVDSLMQELASLRQNYMQLSNSVFGKLASYAMPKGSAPINLTRKGVTLHNTRFTFAGSTESRKGAYRCLLNEFRNIRGNDRYLIVDVVSETSIDYVFEIKKVVNGIEWFRKGGGVQSYLSETCLKNVQVLSPGLGYLNESYFLTLDWEKRLTELENSGYKVVIFFGDISNTIGRIFHEAFADLGNSIIYVHGNAIGSRTIVSNLRGITNSKSSIVAYFDFNKQVKRFYDMVAKTNECRVLSLLGGK